jgi:arylsulfatase A-like enzyme
MRKLPIALGILIAFIANTALCQSMQTERPNVIVIITDDQGYGDMSCHGNPWMKTPNMDKLYEESTRLTDFHVTPTCAPTRASVMTGHYSNRTGVWHTIGGRSLLRESETTMADVFSSNGYATGMFGKWHLGDNYPFRPQDRGFQEVLIHGGGGVSQGPDYWNNDYFDDTYFHNGKPEKFTGYCTDIWFDNAIRFMDENQTQGQPFFVYLATNAPHSPNHVSNEYVEPYKDNDSIASAIFNGMVANIDENLGKLLRYLTRNELDENTIVVFMSDNGTSAGVDIKDDKIVKGFNAGMRGRKGSMYDGGHRVPCFIRWPQGEIPAGRDVADLTAHVDLLPTFVDILRLKIPAGLEFDGTSLKHVLRGQGDHLPARTLITDSQRLEQPVKWRQSSVMHGPWRLVNGTELYNISQDPGQNRDIADQHPKMVRQLRDDYEAWWKDISPVFKEAPAIALCPVQEPVTILRTHDMHMDEGYDLVPWNHTQIRQGMKSNGWYAVNALEDGVYKFTLMRWPPESGGSLLGGVPAKPAVAGTTVRAQDAGKELDLDKAGISIGRKKDQKIISEAAGTGVTFEVSVKAGHHKLRAWFVNGEGESLAAYYVKVEKK